MHLVDALKLTGAPGTGEGGRLGERHMCMGATATAGTGIETGWQGYGAKFHTESGGG